MNTSRPQLIYLDQNKWIDLARAYYSKNSGTQYIAVLKKLQNALQNGSVVLPLSLSHLIETRKVKDTARRKRLVKVMVEFSQGYTIAPVSYLVPLQLENALAELFGEPSKTTPNAIGRSFFEFGYFNQFRDELQIPEAKSHVVLKILQDPNMLEPLLMGNHVGYAGQEFEHAIPIMDTYIKSTERFRAIERVSLSSEERKRQHAAELTYHFRDVLSKLLFLRNKSLDGFLEIGVENLMGFFANVPSLDVEIELVTERDQHWDRSVEQNDIVDVSFLSAAIPYCDVVVTERFWAH